MVLASVWACDDAERISRTLGYEDGHLFIGEAGYLLCFAPHTRLSGSDTEAAKAACVAAGVPVIDSRGLPIATALRLAYEDSPQLAPGDAPDALPWHGWAHGRLQTLAALYHAAGAEVLNMPGVTGVAVSAGTGAAA